MHDRQMALVPQRLKRRHRRMKSEKPVKVKHRVAWDIDGRPHGVVSLFAMRDHDIQTIRRAALKDDHQPLVPAPIRRPRKPRVLEKRESQLYPQLPARRCEEILDETTLMQLLASGF